MLHMETFKFEVRFWYVLPCSWRMFCPSLFSKVTWQNFSVLLSVLLTMWTQLFAASAVCYSLIISLRSVCYLCCLQI